MTEEQKLQILKELANLVNEGRNVRFEHEVRDVPNPASASGRPRREPTGIVYCHLNALPTERHLTGGTPGAWRALGDCMETALQGALQQREVARNRWKRDAPGPSEEEEEGDPPDLSHFTTESREQSEERGQRGGLAISANLFRTLVTRGDELTRCPNPSCGHRAVSHRLARHSDGRLLARCASCAEFCE